jgi:hypothetical protein
MVFNHPPLYILFETTYPSAGSHLYNVNVRIENVSMVLGTTESRDETRFLWTNKFSVDAIDKVTTVQLVRCAFQRDIIQESASDSKKRSGWKLPLFSAAKEYTWALENNVHLDKDSGIAKTLRP